MRFLLFVVLLAGVGFAGWIAGSLNPAPAAILAPIQDMLAGDASEATYFTVALARQLCAQV